MFENPKNIPASQSKRELENDNPELVLRKAIQDRFRHIMDITAEYHAMKRMISETVQDKREISRLSGLLDASFSRTKDSLERSFQGLDGDLEQIEIRTTLDEGLDILNGVPEKEKTDRQRWAIQLVSDTLKKSSDDGRHLVSSQGHSQREGIPVDDLMEELGSLQDSLELKLKSGDSADDKGAIQKRIAKIKIVLDVLEKNSRSYQELHGEDDGVMPEWRIAHEASLISQSKLGSDDPEKDLELAMNNLKKRRELVFDDMR